MHARLGNPPELTESYSRIASELSDWKRLILAARKCRNKGNVKGAAALYRRGLSYAKQAGLEYSAELISFLAAEVWGIGDGVTAPLELDATTGLAANVSAADVSVINGSARFNAQSPQVVHR